MTLEFDDKTHTYRIDGREVPSVTQIISAVFPNQYAGITDASYVMQRGQAVHACAALIGKGIEFDFDPAIAGQVAACRLWYQHTNAVPMMIEQAVCNPVMMYAGTLDLVCKINKQLCLVDWKSTIVPTAQWQLGAYAACLFEKVHHGMAVQLNADGTYQSSPVYKLDIAGREFANIRAVYGMMERTKMINKKEAV